MQLTVVSVFALNILGVHGGCFHDYGPGWGWRYSTNHPNYQCVQKERCFDSQYNLTSKDKRVTQRGRCIIHGDLVFGQVCCRYRTPPTRRSDIVQKRPPSHLMVNSSPVTNRRPQSQPEQHISTQTFSQDHLHRQSPTSSSISSSQRAACKCIPRNNCRDRQLNNFQFTNTVSLNTECACTPFFRCYDEETSSNLSGLVDDRTLTQSCPTPNEICCYNQVQPSNPSQESQQQSLPGISPLSNAVNCDCIPPSECRDYQFDSENNNIPFRQGTCPNVNHVCCLHLVQPLSTSGGNPSAQFQPVSPLHIPTQRPTLNLSPLPQSPSPSQLAPHIPTVVSSPDPQPSSSHQLSTQRPTVAPSPPSSPSPSQSSSPSTNCLCTPFYKCYDEETSSNLAGLVDDRTFDSVAEMKTCLGHDEICCHNLVKPAEKPPKVSSSENCSGSCVLIQECPNLTNTLNEARRGKSDAIQTLRNLVCSVRDGRALVCCQ